MEYASTQYRVRRGALSGFDSLIRAHGGSLADLLTSCGMAERDLDFPEERMAVTDLVALLNAAGCLPGLQQSGLQLAAVQGNAHAQFSLGFLYATGAGVPKNNAEAVRWYRLAAAQGNARAQYNLGDKYKNGEGVPQDDTEAVRWYRLAGAQGNVRAQGSLGLMYATGAGVPQNYQRAYMWFSLEVAGQSAANRDIAVINRDRASEYLTPEQLSLAQVQATRCFNSNFTDCGEPD